MFPSMRAQRLLLTLVMSCSATSCHLHISVPPTNGLAMFPVAGPGDHMVIVPLDARIPVRFTDDLDLTFDDLQGAGFSIDLFQDGVVVAQTVCDPIDVRMCAVHVRGSGNYIASCRMQCAMHLPKSGPTLVRARFETLGTNVRVLRANLIVQQCSDEEWANDVLHDVRVCGQH
jgi:hypothetical protein